MARTKQTARVAGKGPSLASKAAQKKSRKGKPLHILKQARRRRFSQRVSTLREIRKSQLCVQLCFLKAPFQRVVRGICEDWNLAYRWRRSALMCIQEAAEDFLIEFFCDLCILAAHAHRMTIMVKDSETLKRIRWRYDKLLHPADFVDPKMRDILLIPPARKPKDVVVYDITHNVNTRAKTEQDELQRQQSSLKQSKEKGKESVKQKQSPDQIQEIREYERETSRLDVLNLQRLKDMKKDVFIFIKLSDGERQLTLDVHDLNILRKEREQINDSIIYVCLK